MLWLWVVVVVCVSVVGGFVRFHSGIISLLHFSRLVNKLVWLSMTVCLVPFLISPFLVYTWPVLLVFGVILSVLAISFHLFRYIVFLGLDSKTVCVTCNSYLQVFKFTWFI